MAERLTHQETESFYDLTTEFSDYDPGLDAFSDAMRRAETMLNTDGGAQSVGYRGILLELNQEWDYFDETATISGKVYVLEDDIVQLAAGNWNGPHHDSRGTYFFVEDAQLMSLGIIDGLEHSEGTVDEDGQYHKPVELVYAFNPDDIESDTPLFYARPDDILSAKYDMPTLSAIDSRLHHRWPEQMTILDRRIDNAGLDPMKQVRNVRTAVERLQDTLISNEDLRLWLGKYLHARLELDRTWPYGVTMKGEVRIIDEQGEIETVTVSTPSTQYLKSAGVSIEHHSHPSGEQTAQVNLIFYAPAARTEGEYSDVMMSVPLASIVSIFSTRPMGSISESLEQSLEYAQLHGEPIEPDLEVVTGDTERQSHDRQVEFERLVQLEALLQEVMKRTDQLRRTRHATQQDALEVSSVISQWLYEEKNKLNLQTTDVMRIAGDGIIKPNASIIQSEHSFRVDVNSDYPIITPTIAADIQGIFDGVVAEADRYEDDEGIEFWLPSPKLAVMTQSVKAPIIPSNFPILTATVKSVAIARLDGTVAFELPQLAAMRHQRETLGRLGLLERKSRLYDDMKEIDQLFFDEQPGEWTAATESVLRRIRRTSTDLSTVDASAAGIEAFVAQFVGKKVQIVADIWTGSELKGQHESLGEIVDVYRASLPDGTNELVAALASGSVDGEINQYAQKSELVVLKTVRELKF